MNRNLLSILLFLPGLFATAQVKEKVFVHTDKEFYLAGEIMWYKIYTVDSFSHRPLPLSKVAYVEIVARDQRSVAQARIALDEGLGNGSFQLPFSIRSGNYVLRAYTNWMKNKGPDCFYEKNITILNTLRDPALIDSLIKAPPDNGSPNYDIQFFPEGGDLVAGLPTHIAFRIVDRSGNPVACKGTVLKPTGDPLVHFQTLRFGMGEFSLTPEPNTVYRVSIETDDRQQLTTQLPMPEKQGYTMQVTDAGTDQLRIMVHTNNNDPGLKLLISSRQKEDKPVTNGEAGFIIEKNSLPDGISRLTILTNNNLPVCERLWFKTPTPLTIQAHPDKDSYATREKVNVGLSCTDPSGMPVKLDGSMAVILLDSLQSLTSDDLLSYLFLSSELKGAIIDPGYYFSAHTPEVQATTDLLMLTQGWRKFQYTQSPRIAPEYAGLIVTGKITDKRTSLPAPNIPAWICAPGNYFHLAYATSDTNGMIQWNLGLLYGEHELVIQTAQPNNNRYRIDINSSFSETTPRSPFPGLRLPHTATQQLLWRSIGAQTQNAWQAGLRQHFSQPVVSDTTPFYGHPSIRFLLDDYTRFSTMEEVMREYARETNVKNRNGNFSISVQSDQANQLFFDTPPLVLMDGVPVPDFNAIIRFDPLKIRKIEVVSKRYFLGDTLYSGILSYTTYQGDLAGFPLDSSAYIQEYEGLQAHREFYSPLYETAGQQNSRIADFRNVLFWEPNVRTDEKGNISRSFFTSDLPGRYAIVVQGITADGRAGKGVAAFSVQSTGKK